MDQLIPSVRAVLATTAARWQVLTGTLPLDLLTRPPAAGEWSALECLKHLLDTERAVFPVRVQAFLAGLDFPAFDPNKKEGQAVGHSPIEMVAEFTRLRAQSLPSVEALTEQDLPRRARHPDLGPVTLGELLHTWAAHDLMHTVQAERSLMQPFIAGCGAWRGYFSDHDVRAGSKG